MKSSIEVGPPELVCLVNYDLLCEEAQTIHTGAASRSHFGALFKEAAVSITYTKFVTCRSQKCGGRRLGSKYLLLIRLNSKWLF